MPNRRLENCPLIPSNRTARGRLYPVSPAFILVRAADVVAQFIGRMSSSVSSRGREESSEKRRDDGDPQTGLSGRLGIPAAMASFCGGRISYGSVGHPTLYQVRSFNLLRMVSLPFDGLRAVSKVEPSNHRTINRATTNCFSVLIAG